MAGYVFLLLIIVGGFLFAVFGVISLIGKTNRLTERIDRLEERLRFYEPASAAQNTKAPPQEFAAEVPETLDLSKIPVTWPEEAAAVMPESTIMEGFIKDITIDGEKVKVIK